MNWLPHSARSVEVSECGAYELRRSVDPHRGEFFNAWHLPTGKHVEASHHRREVVAAVERHAAKACEEAV